MRSQRQLRVGEEIRHALADVFQHGDMPWPEGVPFTPVTVTEVQVSPDLQNATAFIMPLGGAHVAEIVKTLNNRVGFFRHELAHSVKMRFVPKLHFAADTSFDYAQKIENLLHQPTIARDVGYVSIPPSPLPPVDKPAARKNPAGKKPVKSSAKPHRKK
jgi:ribosome-binding factor A